MARQGEIIDGKYEVLREVGRGGMSVVYLAMDRRLNKQWAIKEFRKDKDDASKQVALKALLDEANLMKKLDHPTLPRIVDIIDNNENVYVIMDYIEGESLNKVLDAYGAQPQDAVIEWAKQLSEVLDYLHTQNPPVIYRDMKPANIMLKPDGTVRLIDFGIAREYKEGKEGDTEAIGTRGYAAPEQFGGRGQTDARTDIYSLGVTLYHLITGKNPAEPPYEIYPIRHWDPSFSGGLEWLIQKCTQLNPEDRYQSCAEVTYVLENLDKFDATYKRKQKSRLSLFVISAVMTVIFTLTSIASFVGAVTAQKNEYEQLVKDDNFLEAIEVDTERPEAYVELAKHLSDNVVEVVSDDDKNGEVSDYITTGDLEEWFKEDAMNALEQNYPQEYARINFELGFLLWCSYQEKSSKDQGDKKETEENETKEFIENEFTIERMNEVLPYFEAVIKTAQNNPDLENAGLVEDEYTFASTMYRVAYFEIHLNSYKVSVDDTADDRGSDMQKVKELNDTIKYAANINEGDANAARPFAVYWDVLEDVLEDMESGKLVALQDSFKLRILKNIAYHVHAERTYFVKHGGIDAERVEHMFDLLKKAYSDIQETDSKIKAWEKLNEKVAAIEGSFKIESGTLKEILGYSEKNNNEGAQA